MICTTNVIERLFGEVKKRSHKMAAAFRNETSCLLMFYAVIRSLKFRRISMPARRTAWAGPALLQTCDTLPNIILEYFKKNRE